MAKARSEHKIKNTAIVRIEQLYPFPHEELRKVINRYTGVRELVWCQEEPRNQGAWFFIQSRRNMKACIQVDQELRYAGRTYSASPASGSLHIHKEQQQALIEDALGLREQTSR